MPDFNRDGRPDSPYYDNQLDSVTEDIGGGVLALRTTGGGGGGGDATAANQVLEIAELTALNTSVGYDGVNSLNTLLFGIGTTLGDDGAGTTNQILNAIEERSMIIANTHIGNFKVYSDLVLPSGSIDITGRTLIGIVNTLTGNCLPSAVFTIRVGLSSIDHLCCDIVSYFPSGSAHYDFGKLPLTVATLLSSSTATKTLSGSISSNSIYVITIENSPYDNP